MLGLLYGFLAWLLTWGLEDIVGISIPEHFRAAILAVVPFLATGGIHCDGFMDTVDGIFSGRERDRMLEIMKDSRTGSFGVVAFGILLLMQYTLLLLAILDGWFSLAAVAAGYVFLYLFGRYVTKLLGGLTGDVYGAVCTLTELLTLAVYLFVQF